MQPETSPVYGPVKSRRFGWDLGINLLPAGCKLCTFDCIYCQYGKTPPPSNKAYVFPSSSEVISAWEKQLTDCEKKGIKIEHTTFSGNGESTMHPKFCEIVDQVVHWRDQNAPQIKLALLTNGFRIQSKKIRKAMETFDEAIVKLDSAVPEKFAKINRPLIDFSLTNFLLNLKKVHRPIIQTLFIKNWNDQHLDLVPWRDALFYIKPIAVQIYTVCRDTAVPGLDPLSEFELRKIAEETMRITGTPVHAYV
jgi:wyosine [tRNA(Phe)-imidazoG37] synthetase (radical SAM superfamily)